MTNIKGFQAETPDLTLTINRTDLEPTLMGATSLEAQIADGKTSCAEGEPELTTRPGGTMSAVGPELPIRDVCCHGKY